MDRMPADKDILELITVQERHGTLVSIYLPSHSQMTPEEIDNELVAFGDTVDQINAEITMRNIGMDETKMMSSLLKMLADDYKSWRSTRHAMAIFISPEDARTFIIPIECDGLVHVDSHFVLAPLMVATNMLEEDYVLHLELQAPRLYRVTLANLEFEVMHDIFGNDDLLADYVHEAPRRGLILRRKKSLKLSFDEEIERLRAIDESLRNTELPDTARILLAGNKGHLDVFKRMSRFSIRSEIVLEGRRARRQGELQMQVHDRLQSRLRRMAGEFRDVFVAAGADNRVSSEQIDRLQTAAGSGGVRTLSLSFIELPKRMKRKEQTVTPRLNLKLEHQQIEQLETITQSVYRNNGSVIGAFMQRTEPHMMFALTR